MLQLFRGPAPPPQRSLAALQAPGITEASTMFLAGEHHVLEPAGSGEWEDYMRKTASTAVPVHPLLAERWSPRGFDQSHQVSENQVTALLEAARWAPSAGNSQPWRFLVT